MQKQISKFLFSVFESFQIKVISDHLILLANVFKMHVYTNL